jgi:hypothetical protein
VRKLAWTALFAAHGRTDQAAWREDRRRREHPVAVVRGLAPAPCGPPALPLTLPLPTRTLPQVLPGQCPGLTRRAMIALVASSPWAAVGSPGALRRPAVARSLHTGTPRNMRTGTPRDKGTVRGEGTARTRARLARPNRPGIELVVVEPARRNRPGRHRPGRHRAGCHRPGRHRARCVLAGTVLIRRNRPRPHLTRRRLPGCKRAWTAWALSPLLHALPGRGRPGTRRPGIRLRRTCRHWA